MSCYTKILYAISIIIKD